MANEVTINIESSLAAMAFVVADQQEQIKTLREKNGQLENQYNDLRIAANNELTDLHKEIDEITKDCQDRLGIISEKEDKIAELQMHVSTLQGSNQEFKIENNGLKEKMLGWHEIGDYEAPLTNYKLPFDIENHPLQPCILLKVAQIKDGCYDNNNQSIPIGTQMVQYAYPGLIEGNYVINYNDSYTRVIAWCVVSDKNF